MFIQLCLKATVFCLFFLTIFSFYSADYVYWNQRRYLTWEDFRVRHQLPKDEKDVAGTSSSCWLTMTFEDNLIHLNISTVMFKNKSWVKDNHRNVWILAHEQGHFDIVEINTRKLRKDISSRSFKDATYHHDLDSLLNDCNNKTNIEQDLYDNATNHSIDSAAQIAWLKKIEQDLKESEPYKKPEVTIVRSIF